MRRMTRPRGLRAVPTAATAASGVLVAHWVAYLVAIPHGPVRAVLLAATGHGYWTQAVRLVVALGGCGLVATLLANLPGSSRAPDRPAFSALVLRLIAIQCAAF